MHQYFSYPDNIFFRGTRAEQWAGYARIFAPFNTSMLVERFHKRLKYEYRGRVGNSRIDSIVNCLITAPEVIAHDFEIRVSFQITDVDDCL